MFIEADARFKFLFPLTPLIGLVLQSDIGIASCLEYLKIAPHFIYQVSKNLFAKSLPRYHGIFYRCIRLSLSSCHLTQVLMRQKLLAFSLCHFPSVFSPTLFYPKSLQYFFHRIALPTPYLPAHRSKY